MVATRRWCARMSSDIDMELGADDRLAIYELYARYNLYMDTGEADRWADLFTDDGSFSGTLTVTGAADLRSFALARWAERDSAPFSHTQHWVNNISLDPDPVGVRGSCDLMWIGRKVQSGEYAIITVGRFADTLARRGKAWKFTARVFTPAR
jgi:SnoaL-like domain